MNKKLESKHQITIWSILDGKVGHEKQSLGVVDSLARLRKLDCREFHCKSRHIGLLNWMLGRFPLQSNQSKPDIILGAGHSTHLDVLAAKKAHGGKSIIVMKPSLPLAFFDLCIIPRHDNPPARKNIIISDMPLPSVNSNRPINKNLGIFLIGGPSRHFKWSNQQIIEKIVAILADKSNEGMKWKLSNSRRTPQSFLDELGKRNLKELELLNCNDTPSDWVERQLSTCHQAWVTQDSYSMICEAANLCTRVGVIEITAKKTVFFPGGGKFAQLPSLPITSFGKWLKTKEMRQNNLHKEFSPCLGEEVLRSLDF